MARRDQSNQRKLELLKQLTNHRKDISFKKQVLIQQIAESKEQLQDKINIPKLFCSKIKSSYANSPAKWFIGSALGGLLISKLFLGPIFKKQQEKNQKGSHGLFYSIVAMAARPMIKSFLIGKARDYLAQRFLVQEQQQTFQQDSDHYNRT